MMLQVAAAVHHFEKIAAGQVVSLEETPIFVFNREVKSPKIATVLVGRVFLWLIDDPELDPVSVRRGYAGQVEEAETDALEHALLAALTIVSLLDAGAQIDFVPEDGIRPSEVSFRLEGVIACQRELPHILAHGVTPNATSRTV